MDQILERTLRAQLADRRARIEHAMRQAQGADLARLLRDVDAALARLDVGRFGECEVCKTFIGDDILQVHPLIPWCLCEMSAEQQAALQRDLDLASRIQRALLPDPGLSIDGWSTHYRYLAAGPVSGDYCDVVASSATPPRLDFLIGDVMGHGVAASFLMARLNALFRSLVEGELPLPELMARIDRLFQDRASENHFVTALAGRAWPGGEVEICNAGHCPPVIVGREKVTPVDLPAGLPIGVDGAASFEVHRLALAEGDSLFLFTDGVVEARAGDGRLFGEDGLAASLGRRRGATPQELSAGCIADLDAFRAGHPFTDDVTVLVLRHELR